MPEIHVCTVIASGARHADLSVCRQLFRQNRSRDYPRSIRPSLPPGSFVRLVERPRAEALVGTVAYALMLAARLALRVIERMVGQQDCSSRKRSRLQLAGICPRVLIPARTDGWQNTGSASCA